MGLSQFLISLLEFYLSFGTECLYSNFNIISIFVLWLGLLLFIFFKGIPSIPNFWKNEHKLKHKVKVKRRRKGGTGADSRYYYSKVEEEKELIAFLKSPLGRNHDSIHFRRLLCPDASCGICNNATAEINRLFSKALEGSTPSVSPVVSIAPVTDLVTEPSFHQSSDFPGISPAKLIPTPLPEPSTSPPTPLSSNSMTTLGNLLSPSPLSQTLLTEPSSHSGFKFSGQKSPPQPKDMLSSTLTQYDFHKKLPDIHSTKISSVEHSAAKLIDPTQLLFLSPDEHESVEQHSYPKTWEDNFKQKLIQLFWGLPSLHSESLSSAVHASGDYSVFNSISNTFTGQGSPGLPYFLPPSLPEGQLQPLPQTLPQSQHLHLTELQPQVHLKSPLPILPYGLRHQTKVCGVYCHTPLNESEGLISPDIEQLEFNVLKKKQECLLSLSSLAQSSYEACCPSAFTSPYSGPFKAHTSISTDHFEYPVSVEFRKKIEQHLKKRLIQHRWGLPKRIHESLTLMKPRGECSARPQPKCTYGLSGISTYVVQDSKILNEVTLSSDFYKKGSDLFQLSEDDNDSLASYPKGLLTDSDSDSDKDLGNDCDTKSVSRQNGNQRQLANFLKVHVSKNFEEIGKSELPSTLQSSNHSAENTLSVESQREFKQICLPPSVGGDNCLNKSQDISFLEASTPDILEDHDTNLPMKTLGGHPAKLIEFTEDFKSKGTTSHSLINSYSSSSTKVISEVNTESGAFMPLCLHSEKMGTENSVPVLNLHLPAISLVDKERQGIQQGYSGEIQTMLETKPCSMPARNTSHGKTSHSHSLMGNIQPSELPARQTNGECVPKNKSVNSTDTTEMKEATNRDEAEPASMPTMPREIGRAEELYALQSETAIKQGISQKEKRDTTVTTEKPPSKISDAAPNLSELRKQLIAEMNLKLMSRKHSQAQGQPLDMSSDSDSLTNKASLAPDKCVSSANREVHQVLHVHSENSAVRMVKQQEPWLPKHALRSCQDQIFPPVVKKDVLCPPSKPTGPKYEELGAGDARLRISQPGGKRFPSQDTGVEVMRGSKSFHSLSQRGQAPPDSLFLNKMKSLFQRLCPTIQQPMQETTQEMVRHMSPAQSRGPVRSRAAFPGTVQAHRVMSDIGKFPEEKRGRQHAGVTTCPQDPLPSAGQSGKPVQQGAVQARVKLVQGRPLNCRAPFSNVTNMKSGLQAAISDDQISTSIRHTWNEDSSQSKAVTLKGQHVCQKHPQSVSLKMGTVPHQSCTSRPQDTKGPPAVLTTAGGPAFKNRSSQFRHRMLLYNFQRETFPTPK